MAREFSVIVSIDAKRAVAGGRQFKQGADQVARSSRKMTRSMNASRRSATALITTIGRIRGVATLAFAGFLGVGGLGSIVKTIAQFEQGMKRVEALLGDRAVGGAMKALTEKARELGATTAFTATQAAEGMGFLTLAGFDALETFQAIEPALQLAQAGMLGLGEAADIVSNIMQGFNIEASETQKVVDALAHVATRSNTSIRQLGQAMKFVAPVAGAVGLSVEETAAALGLLGNSGLQASLAGTSLRRVLSGLLNPSKEATKIFEKMGLQSEDLVDALSAPGKGLTFVIKALEEAGLGAAAAFTLFGQRGAPGLLSLTGQTKDLEKFNDQLKDVAGTARTIGEVMLDNLAGDARISISVLQEAIIRLGEAGLREWLRDVTQAFAGFIRGISDQEQAIAGASERVLAWNRSGIALRENIHLIRRALVVLVTFMNRAFIGAVAKSSVAIVSFTVSLFRGATAMQALRRAALLLSVSMKTLRTAIITTGIGALAVAVGFLIDWIFFSEDAESQNNRTTSSFERQKSVISDLAFHYNRLTKEERGLAIVELEKHIQNTTSALANRTLALTNAQKGTARLEVANVRLLAAEEAVNDNLTFGKDERADAFREGTQANLLLLEREAATLQVAEAQALFNSANGASIQELGALREELSKSELRLRAWNDVWKGTFDTIEDALASYNNLTDANELYSESLLKQTGLSQIQAVQLESLRKEYGKNEEKLEELATAMETLSIAATNTDATLAELATTQEELARITEEVEFKIRKLQNALSPFQKAVEKMEDKIAKLRAGEDKVKLAIVEHEIAQRNLTRELIIADTPVKVMIELLRLQAEAHGKNIEALEAECAEIEKFEECMTDASKAMETLWEQALRNIQDAFADAFMGAFDSFESFADKLLDAFKTLFANIAAEALILNIFGGGTGFFADLASGLSRGFGSGGTGGVPGSTGGILGGTAGGMFGPSSALGSAFSAFSAGAVAFFQGAGAFLGAGSIAGISLAELGIAGTGLGGIGVSGSALSAAGASTSAVAGSVVAGAGIGFLTGAVTDALLGSRGSSTRNAIFSAVGGAIGGFFGGAIGAVVGGAIGSFVDNLFGGARALESAVLEVNVAADQWFGAQTEITSRQRSFFRGRSFTTTVNDVTDSLTGLEGAFATFASVLQEGATVLGGNAEGFLDGFAASLEIDLRGTSSEEIEQILADFLRDTMLGAIDEFLQNVGGLEVHVQAVLRSFSNDIEGFVMALDLLTSIQNLFDIDLLEEATNAIVESQSGIVGAYQRSLEGFREVVAEYDGSLEALELLTNATAIMIQVQLDLITVYQQTGDAISSLFQGSAQTIRESLLSEEELFTLRQTQIDDLIAQAAMTTDPEELQRLASEINRLGLDAFNILDEDQRAALAPEFIEFFDMLNELFGGQIDEGIDSVLADQAALDEEVSNRLLEAATAMLEAARITAAAAANQGNTDFGSGGGGGGSSRDDGVNEMRA